MLVRDLGEFELIDRLAAVIAAANEQRIAQVGERGFRMLRAIGDDAAAWQDPSGVRVLTTDTMVERVHFDLRYTNWRDLGWKCLATNISDVAAMGCVPTWATVTLGLRPDISIAGLEELYKGVMELTDECGGAVVGGDIVKSPVFFISVALEGAAAEGSQNRLLLRDKASPGDRIAVTGHLGSSGGGLRLLQSDMDAAAKQADAFASAHLRRIHNRPTPRVQAGISLAQQGVRCAMDISDGLVDDLRKLCSASSVQAIIRTPSIPVDARLKAAFPQDWLALALGGGEDYELLFTAPPEIMHKAMADTGVPLTVIGEIVAGEPGVTVVDAQGKPLNIASGGWDHFRAE